MAGLFSKKSKRDKDDASSASSTTNNAHYQARPSNSTVRDNGSTNNSITHSQSDYSRHSPYSQHQQHPSGPSVYSSKNSLQHSSQQQLQYSATSFSTHQSASTANLTGPWSSGQVMSTNPFPRFAHTASFVTTGTDIYVFGGIVKGSAQKDVHVIDTQSLHCQVLPVGGNGPPALTGHTAVTLGQYVMYFGGKDAKGKTTDALYVLHTARKEWNRPLIQTLLPPPRHSHAACVIGTVMYIIGGQLSGYFLNDIASFDLKTLNGKRPAWTQLEPKSELPPARAGHCAAAYEGKVYIFGGADNQYYYNDIWCYDPKVNKWEPIPSFGTLPSGRQGHTVSVIDDTMYIYGGMNHEDQLLGDFCAFKFNGEKQVTKTGSREGAQRKWITSSNTPETPSRRTEHAMCNVGDKIYILGGQLDLNASEDPGLIHVLDTTKIRWGEPSVVNSQNYAHDNDSSLRVDDDPNGRISPYIHKSGTPDSAQQDDNEQGAYSQNPDRIAYQHHYQQQQQISEHQDSYRNEQHQRHHQQYEEAGGQQENQQRQLQSPYANSLNGSRAKLAPVDDSQIGTRSPSNLSLDVTESVQTARRRTIGKPVGYVTPEIESRGTLSIDEVRRPATADSESFDQRQARGPVLRHASSAQGLSDDMDRVRSSPSHDNHQSRTHTPLHQQFSHLELNRHGSTSTTTESLNRNGSYTSITHMQPNVRVSTDPSQRSPLRITNPDDDLQRQDSRRQQQQAQEQTKGHQQLQGSNSSTPVPMKESELKDLRQREQWLLAEVSMARKKMGERPLSMAIMALEDELEVCEVDSEKYRIMQALLNVKAELERSKTSIATQAQIASNKVREAERIRTSALQEAAYLKAKVNALQSGEVSALISTESERAADLEKRLTSALTQLDKYEAQFVQYETILEHERLSRESAEERERDASSRAEEAQMAHTRALNELTTLHERASVAEASLRETVAKSASSEAGLSSYQQQSAALFSQISNLKTTVDQQKKSLGKVKMAYTVANERAEHADRLWTQSRQEMDQTQLELANVRAQSDRSQHEAEHWRTKASETELLWQRAKKDSESMRALLEEDMNASYADSTSKERKHDSILAITSASRVAELEHELATLRQVLTDSQEATTQANKDLGDTMIRISQLEQSSMSARAEAATAQRQLKEAREKASALQAQLVRKEETVEEMVKEQENNEVQLGLLLGVMKENGLMADDLIFEALNQSAEGRVPPGTVSPLKMKIQEAENRATEAENRLGELQQTKNHQEERIQQLEADYQTAVHYVQGTESMLQKLRDEAQLSKNSLKELEDIHAQCSTSARHGDGELAAELEEEVADLHRQLHESHERSIELEQTMNMLSAQLRDSESRAESSQADLRSIKAKYHEQKKRGVDHTDQFQTRLEQLEQSLADTQKRLETSQDELEHAHELNRVTGQELEDALDALKRRPSGETRSMSASSSRRQEELEAAVEGGQRTIRSLQQLNQELEEQLRASENKISLLLDNFHAPESVRNSVVSLSGLTAGTGLHHMASSPPSSASLRSHILTTPPSSSNATPTALSPTSTSKMGSGRSAEGATNSQKLAEYERMIEEMTSVRRQYDA
ncbi:Negative regulator of mitotic exit [Mortierella antarctica]|nr:Negative regulator of mitotic exit [Mortierella antarctica]